MKKKLWTERQLDLWQELADNLLLNSKGLLNLYFSTKDIYITTKKNNCIFRIEGEEKSFRQLYKPTLKWMQKMRYF